MADAQPYRRMVACIDFSDHAGRAFDEAVALARDEGAALTLLHVVVPGLPPAPGLAAKNAKELSDKELAEVVRGHLRQHYLPRAQGVEVKIALRRGHPSEEILGHLADHPADLVVLGSQGLSAVKRALLGSVAERVARKASCSCLVVR